MHDQLKYYFDKILSKYQCLFRKEFSIQYCLLVMIQKLQKNLDCGVVHWGVWSASATVVTDLSKAFDCLSTTTPQVVLV